MSVVKHLILSSISKTSWDDAINSLIENASKTVDNISGLSIVSKSANITNNKITEYVVDADLSFVIDEKK